MEITEVRIKLMEASEDRLRAFCSITIDQCFVIRDLKIIAGANGPFVAMPSRKLTERCPKCGYKNHLRSNFCNQCGAKIRARADSEVNANKLYADIAHPINQACRDIIQKAVVTEYEAELKRAELPGYKSRYDDEYAEGARHLSGDDAVQFLNQADEDQSGRRRGTEEAPRARVDSPEAAAAPPSPHLERGETGPRVDTTQRIDPTPDNDDFGKGILDD